MWRCVLSVLACLAVACGTTSKEAEVTEAKSREARELFDQAEAARRARDWQGALGLYEQTSREAAGALDDALQAEALAQSARMYSVLGDQDQGRPRLALAEQLASPDDSGAWARLLIVRGVYAREDGDMNAAVADFVACYDYCMERERWGDAVDAAHHVAIAGDAPTREEWAKKGIAAAEEAGESGWLGPLWNNLGWDYIDQGRNEEALAALLQAQAAHHAAGGHPVSALVSDYSVGFALRLNGEYERARGIQSGVHRQALTALDEGDGSMLEWVAQSRRELGELDALQGDPAAGAAKIAEAIAELKQTDFMQWGAEYMRKYEARLAELRAMQ